MSIKNFNKTVEDIPTCILTCDKLTNDALKCRKRLEDYGFSDIKLTYGDNDDRLTNKKIHWQARSFISTCLDMIENDTEYVFIFEEDAEIVENRSDKFKRSIEWALQNKDKWDIIYGGCAALNPMFPSLDNLDLSYSSKAQAGAHSMLFSLHAAKEYVKYNGPDYDLPFDMALRKLNLRSYTTFLPAWYQNKNPTDIVHNKLDYIGDHRFWQDFTAIAWTYIVVTIILCLIFIGRQIYLKVSKNKT